VGEVSLGPVGGGVCVCVVGAVKEVVAKEANATKVVNSEGGSWMFLALRVEIMPILVGSLPFP
jgi:hypothetical protein